MRLAKPLLDVAIVPSDPEATCAFYRDVMGFPDAGSMALGKRAMQRRFRVGGSLLKCNCLGRLPEREPGGIESAIGMRLLAFVLDDLDAVLERLHASGRKSSRLPVPDSLPYRVAFAKDPEGNVLELVGLRRPAGDALSARLQVGLTVADVERSRHFYGVQLGLPEEAPMQVGGAVGTRYGFTWGRSTVKFWKAPGELPVHTGSPHDRAGIRMITAMVEDLEEVLAELRGRQVSVAMEPFELPGVARIAFIADPDGNWIELAQAI